MFCVECGAEEKLYGKLCMDCISAKPDLISHPSHVNILVCGDCGSVQKGAHWKRAQITDIVHEVLTNELSYHSFIESAILAIPEIDYEVGEKNVDILVTLNFGGQTLERNISVKIRVKHGVCDVCSRQKGNYYEAIIQIRAAGRVLTKEELAWCSDWLNKKSVELMSSDRLAFITKETDVKGGKDFYFGSSGTARTLAKHICDNNAGTFTETSSHFGHRDGREIFRFTYLVRYPKFVKGDVISDGKSVFIIEHLASKKIVLKNLESREPLNITSKDFDNFTWAGNVKNAQTAVVAYQSETDIQIVDPVTMKTVELMKSDGFEVDGESVQIIRIDDEIYLV